MHILNIVVDDERPETIRKPIIPELDLNDWEELADTPIVKSSQFSEQIAMAVADGALSEQRAQSVAKLRAARLMAIERFKMLANDLKEETGVSFGYGAPYAYKPKPKAAYGLWKRVITKYIDQPETLDMRITAMVAQLNKLDIGYTVTRDMFYDQLNTLAKSELERLLKKLGVTLNLRGAVTICSVRQALKKRREAANALPVEEFSGRFVICGNIATVNGTEYKIQLGRTGKPRIKHRGEWLPLEVLKSICSAT